MDTKLENTMIELKGTGVYTRWTCDICGELQDKDGMLSCITYPENDGSTGQYDICRVCLDAGIEGAAARSIEHAKHIDTLAEVHRNFIPNILIRSVSEWKTGADYDAVCKAFEDELIRAMTADPESPMLTDDAKLLERAHDALENTLRVEMDNAAFGYYQCGVLAADMDAVMKRDDARYFDTISKGQPANDTDTAQYSLGKRALETYHANQQLDENREAYETAFNAYYEYIFKRDYVGFPEGTDVSKERIERKR